MGPHQKVALITHFFFQNIRPLMLDNKNRPAQNVADSCGQSRVEPDKSKAMDFSPRQSLSLVVLS